MNADTSRHRLGLLAVTALSLFGALFARLWFLQIVEGEALEERVTSNATREVIIPAPRGRILDVNGVVLVDNRESIVVAVDLQEFGDLEETDQEAVLERLATTLSRTRPPDRAVTVEFLEKRLADTRFSRFRPVPVAEDLTVEEEIYFKEQADLFPAVTVERETVREYPYGALAAHLLGYVGALSDEQWAAFEEDNDPDKPYTQADQIGKSGIEATYEPYLRGTPGRQVFEVDRSGRVVRELDGQREEPRPGDDVYLSIDARIQYKAEEALQAWILRSDSPTPAGAATVLDPRDGRIVAMASYPTYFPADLVGGISNDLWQQLTDPETKILSNRAIQEAYPAASTFKLATSYAGVKLGLVAPGETVVDEGVYSLCDGSGSGCKKRNSGGGAAMGPITLSTALTRSSDYYYYRLGVMAWRRHQDVGAPEDLLQQEIRTLGYGERTGVDLTGESPGRVPTPETNRELADALWEDNPANYGNDRAAYEDARRWKAGYSADIAIGQFDTLVTPLQTANAYASLANPAGVLHQPQVVHRITRAASDAVVQPFEPKVLRQVDYGEMRPALVEGFMGVTSGDRGTAVNVFQGFPMESWPVAGKTGTAEVGDDDQQRRDNSLFVGYGPTFDPQFVASVMIEGGGFGSQAAAPAVRMILEPIATGEIHSFEVPRGGGIDAEAAADTQAGVAATGTE